MEPGRSCRPDVAPKKHFPRERGREILPYLQSPEIVQSFVSLKLQIYFLFLKLQFKLKLQYSFPDHTTQSAFYCNDKSKNVSVLLTLRKLPDILRKQLKGNFQDDNISTQQWKWHSSCLAGRVCIYSKAAVDQAVWCHRDPAIVASEFMS